MHKPTHLTVTLYGFLLFWFIPHREVAGILLDTYEAGMRVGDVDTAMYALCLSMRFSLFAGVNLSLLSKSYEKSLTQMVSNSTFWGFFLFLVYFDSSRHLFLLR